MNIAFPFQADGRGRTAAVSTDRHIRDLIEQVLFTSPGERVNRPDFGSGILQFVFAPHRDELLVTTQVLVQGALQQWLGDLIEVEAVDVVGEDARIEVTIRYLVRRTQQRELAQFVRAGGAP